MVRVEITYRSSEGAFFDMDYYMDRHIPVLAQKLGDACKKIEIEGMRQMEGGPPPPILCITHLTFESEADFRAAYDPHAEAAAANRPFFTNVTPEFDVRAID